MKIVDKYKPICSPCFNAEWAELEEAKYMVTIERKDGYKQTEKMCEFHALSEITFYITHPDKLPIKLEIDKIEWERTE